MKKLLTFAGVIALAVAFGLAGAASAGRPEGVGGGPPGGGESESVSYFSSPLIALGICDLDNESLSYQTCTSGKSGACSSDAECDVEVTPPKPEEPLSIDELTVALEKLRKRCESFGNVNLVAIEEYEELKERFEFLTKQQSDLLEAKSQLMSTINKINRSTRQMLR
ncbi:MAG: hypothetical protein IH926_05850 [Proteobacteria bacterium]|nr:hypothetical protein [Pseudomonadota bacterium]